MSAGKALPPMRPVLDLLADGPRDGAYLWANSGLGARTGVAIALAVRHGVAEQRPDMSFSLLPGACPFLSPAAREARLRALCPRVLPRQDRSREGDAKRVALALLVSDILADLGELPEVRRDWDDR